MQTSSLTRPSASSGSTGTTRPSQSTRSSTGSTPRARTLLIMEVGLRSVLDAMENNEICRHQGGLQGLPLICCKTRGGKKTAWTSELLPSPGKTTELDLMDNKYREGGKSLLKSPKQNTAHSTINLLLSANEKSSLTVFDQ